MSCLGHTPAAAARQGPHLPPADISPCLISPLLSKSPAVTRTLLTHTPLPHPACRRCQAGAAGAQHPPADNHPSGPQGGGACGGQRGTGQGGTAEAGALAQDTQRGGGAADGIVGPGRRVASTCCRHVWLADWLVTRHCRTSGCRVAPRLPAGRHAGRQGWVPAYAGSGCHRTAAGRGPLSQWSVHVHGHWQRH